MFRKQPADLEDGDWIRYQHYFVCVMGEPSPGPNGEVVVTWCTAQAVVSGPIAGPKDWRKPIPVFTKEEVEAMTGGVAVK